MSPYINANEVIWLGSARLGLIVGVTVERVNGPRNTYSAPIGHWNSGDRRLIQGFGNSRRLQLSLRVCNEL